jgi:CHAD domain-containing protein
MLKKKVQYHYLEKRQKTVISSLKSFKDSGDAEILHVVRVQIKKTIALLRLYKPLKKCKTREFRDIFKHAGLVRDSAVLLHLIREHSPEHTALIHDQQKLLADHSENFKPHIDVYIEQVELFYQLFSRHLQPVNRKFIVHYFVKVLDGIAEALAQKKDEEELHHGRKRIKDLLYLHELLPSKTRDKLNLNIAYLDTLQDIIGKWHDAIIAHELFSRHEGFTKTHTRKLRKAVDVLARNFEYKAILT